MAYQKILVAVDLGATTDRLLTAAKGIMDDSGSELHAVSYTHLTLPTKA